MEYVIITIIHGLQKERKVSMSARELEKEMVWTDIDLRNEGITDQREMFQKDHSYHSLGSPCSL